MRITLRPSVTLILTAVLLSGCALSGTSGAPGSLPVEEEDHARTIGELLHRLADATNARDFDAFRTDLADDWTYFTSGGSEVDFEGFRGMISGWTALEIAITNVRPRLSGDGELAWATFRGWLRGDAGGDPVTWHLRFTAVLERAGEVWRLRHLQSTVASGPIAGTGSPGKALRPSP